MPLADGNALLGTGEGNQDVLEALEAPGREFNGSLDGIDDPSKDNLASAPVGIPFAKLLDGNGFLMRGGGRRHVGDGKLHQWCGRVRGAPKPGPRVGPG